MKRIFIFIAITILCYNISYSQYEKTSHNIVTWKQNNLKGRVKKVTELGYKIDSSTKKKLMKGRDEFFSDGFGTIFTKYIKEFNNHGFLIDWNLFSNVGDVRRIFDYETNDILVRHTYECSSSSREYRYKYTEDGLIKEDCCYKTRSITYKYDVQNRILEERTKRYCQFNIGACRKGDILSVNIIRYTYLGNKVYCKIFNEGSSESEEKIQYEYDKKGRLISSVKLDYTGKTIERFSYDSNDNIMKRSYYNSEEGIKRVREYHYSYDINKNWIKRTTYINSYPKYEVERIYEYY